MGRRYVPSREQEAVLVLGELPAEPGGAGCRADEDEQPADRQGAGHLGNGVADLDAFEEGVADQPGDLGMRRHVYAGVTLYLVDQVE